MFDSKNYIGGGGAAFFTTPFSDDFRQFLSFFQQLGRIVSLEILKILQFPFDRWVVLEICKLKLIPVRLRTPYS